MSGLKAWALKHEIGRQALHAFASLPVAGDSTLTVGIGLPNPSRSRRAERRDSLFDRRLSIWGRSGASSTGQSGKCGVDARGTRWSYAGLASRKHKKIADQRDDSRRSGDCCCFWRCAFHRYLRRFSILERETRFELATPTLARLCSTTELFPLDRCSPTMSSSCPACAAKWRPIGGSNPCSRRERAVS